MQILLKNWLKLIAINDMLLFVKEHEFIRGTIMFRVVISSDFLVCC
jgi:hypothetical protein